MYTLIEIFDSKQYENIISAVSIDGISKVIYIGTKNTMTREKTQNIKNFFSVRKSNLPVEFFFVERDSSVSVLNTLNKILECNNNCVLDVTGGEDVILVNVGIFAAEHSVPVIRTNAKTGEFSVIYGSVRGLSPHSARFAITDFITLQGGKIRSSEVVRNFSSDEANDIKSLFRVNASDCEAYSIFCNFVSEFISFSKKTLCFEKDKLEKKSVSTADAVISVLKKLCDCSLLKENDFTSFHYSYNIKSNIIATCLKKSGNILEYYAALAASELKNIFTDIRVGTSIEWNDKRAKYETQNEIDVLAVSKNVPVFISCKNGEVKKEALYELDTVSRVLGGAYTKKVLICTYISENASSRAHFIKRAQDMDIELIYDAHKKTYTEFLRYLKNSVNY